jgi:DNA-binding NarL/FixJ family response regulator
MRVYIQAVCRKIRQIVNMIGAFIKSAREMLAITIREAEKRSGISNAYLSQIENGKIKKPSPDILYKISLLYGLPYEMLLEKSGYQIPELEANIQDGDARPVVLIVDDDPLDRELIISSIENSSPARYRVLQASSILEAKSVMDEIVPSCVFLDYRLPDGDGLSLLEQIRLSKRLQNVSVIVITGQGSEDVAVAAIKLGAIDYIQKDGINGDILAVSIDRAIKRKWLRETILEKQTVERLEAATMDALAGRVRGILHGIGALRSRYDPTGKDQDFGILREKTIELEQMLRR